MKRLKYGLLAAAMVASVAVVPAVASAEETATTTAAETTATPPVYSLRGEWVHEEAGWWYKFSDGGYAANEFIGGYWLNKAGWWSEKSQYGWMYTGGSWYYGNRNWMCGSEYQNNKDDNKAKWWKIDGQWYYFAKDGRLVTRAVIDNYIVGDDGAWIEKTKEGKKIKGQWRHGKSAGHEKDWWYAIVDEDGKVLDYFDETDGFVYINGSKYLFDKDGWLIIDGIAAITDENGTTHFVAIDKDGKLVDYTSLVMDVDWPVLYDVELKFEKPEELQAAVKNIKSFLLNTVSSANATKAYSFGIWGSTDGRDVIVGKIMKFDPIEDSGKTIDDEGKVIEGTKKGGWSVAPENVYVQLSWEEEEELFDLIEEKKYTGTWGYDGTDEDVQKAYKEGKALDYWEPVYIPVNNYMTLFAKDKKAITLHGVTNLENIFMALNVKGASYAAELKINLTALLDDDDTTSFTIKNFNVADNSMTLTFDGKDYVAYYVYDIVDAKDADGNVIKDDKGNAVKAIDNDYLIFYGDVTKTIGYKLAQCGLVDRYQVVDSETQDIHRDKVTIKYWDKWIDEYKDFSEVKPEEQAAKTDWE